MPQKMDQKETSTDSFRCFFEKLKNENLLFFQKSCKWTMEDFCTQKSSIAHIQLFRHHTTSLVILLLFSRSYFTEGQKGKKDYVRWTSSWAITGEPYSGWSVMSCINVMHANSHMDRRKRTLIHALTESCTSTLTMSKTRDVNLVHRFNNSFKLCLRQRFGDQPWHETKTGWRSELSYPGRSLTLLL